MTNMIVGGNFHHFLEQEFHARQQRNQRYSLRAFARDLEMSPSTLSEILNHHHRPQPATVAKICRQLGLSAAEQEYWSWLGRHEVAPGCLLSLRCPQSQLPALYQVLSGLAQFAQLHDTNEPQIVLEVFQRLETSSNSGDIEEHDAAASASRFGANST